MIVIIRIIIVIIIMIIIYIYVGSTPQVATHLRWRGLLLKRMYHRKGQRWLIDHL